MFEVTRGDLRLFFAAPGDKDALDHAIDCLTDDVREASESCCDYILRRSDDGPFRLDMVPPCTDVGDLDLGFPFVRGLFTCHVHIMGHAFLERSVAVEIPERGIADHRVDAGPVFRAILGGGIEHAPILGGGGGTVTGHGVSAVRAMYAAVEELTCTRIGFEDEHKVADPELTADGQNFTLMPHQHSHIQWMLTREVPENAPQVWVPLPGVTRHDHPVWWSPAHKRLVSRENVPLLVGGFLMDSMGMGKTVTTIGLCIASPRVVGTGRVYHMAAIDQDYSWADMSRPFVDISVAMPAAGTLIVLPLSLIGQWRSELRTKAPGLSVLVYHGSSRYTARERLAEYDVVLTTYTVVGSESCGPTRSDRCRHHVRFGNVTYTAPLGLVTWTRVVLDESQALTNHTSNVFNGCFGLTALARWCLTGTPCSTSIDDLLPQALFLRDSTAIVSHTSISRRSASWVAWRFAMRSTMSIGHCICPVARRLTQQSRVNGYPVVQIPAPTVEDIMVDLDADELQSYRHRLWELRSLASGSYGLPVIRGMNMLRRHLSGCSAHAPSVRTGDMRRFTGSAPAVHVDVDICPVCFDEPVDAVVTQCGHIYCFGCLDQWFGSSRSATCPYCRTHVHEQSVSLIEPLRTTPVPEQPVGENSRMRKLRDMLSAMEGTDKVLVFIQFQEVMVKINTMCSELELPHFTISGSMSRSERTRNLEGFSRASRGVFTLTVRSGAVGINLTDSTKIIIYEPGLNLSVETQAIARAVRIGQCRNVHVYRLLCRHTIEEGIVRHRRNQNFCTLAVRRVVDDSVDDLTAIL
jgi:hypothetical protein